jgi:hypothetical protein
MYIVDKYKINLYSLGNRLEKLAKGSLFYLFLKLVQINYTFSDNGVTSCNLSFHLDRPITCKTVKYIVQSYKSSVLISKD